MSAPVGFIHSTMTMLMILAGGPLDGEKQICQALNTAIGSIIFFNVPNYQVFHTDNVTVLDQGIEVEYQLASQGGPPGTNDTWTTSWNFNFVPESFVPPPPPVTPTYPPIPTLYVLMADSVTSMTVVGDWSPGVTMSDSVTSMEVDADVVAYQDSGAIAMEANTYMSVDSDWSVNTVVMADSSTSLSATGLVNGQ